MNSPQAPVRQVYLDAQSARLTVPSQLFAPLSPAARREARAEYLHFLRSTDGAPDLATHRLAPRERQMRAIAEARARVRDTSERDTAALTLQQRFTALLSGRSRLDRDVPMQLIWAACALKFSCTENYAVDYLQRSGRYVHDDPNSPYTYIDIHELYHARLLDAALQACGLMQTDCHPRWPTRFMLRFILMLPRSVANIGVFCGEITGVIAFKLLLERVRELTALPAHDRLQISELLEQLIRDELGHVLFLRTQLGPARMRVAKKLLPIVARIAIRDVPEAAYLIDPKLLYQQIITADMCEIARLVNRSEPEPANT